MTKSLNLLATSALALTLSSGLASAGDVVLKGSFEGRSNHIVTGEVHIVKEGNSYKVVLTNGFELDGAPDPTLGFGNPDYAISTNFSELKKLKGNQEYALPANIDPTQFNRFFVWCTQFAVPLGEARLN